MFSFEHCPNYPSPSFGQLVPLFRTSKTTFYAYDRKNTNDDNDGCNNNYDGNVDHNMMVAFLTDTMMILLLHPGSMNNRITLLFDLWILGKVIEFL